MQEKNFFPGCNFSNRDITEARTDWSLCPVQDIDTVLTDRYGVNVNVGDTFSLLYSDLYLNQVMEALRHTMLVHESVFESQINEFHRLYGKQRELMMEMEDTQHRKALYLNSGLPNPTTHWMSSSISTNQTRDLSHEEDGPYQTEARLLGDNKVEKFEKKVLDLELPVVEYDNVHGEVHDAPNFLHHQSLSRKSSSSKLQFDLNEPAMSGEQPDNLFNKSMTPVTSNEIGEKSGLMNEVESLVEGSNGMNEAQGSAKSREEHSFDLNMPPLSSDEEGTITEKFEIEKPQETPSVSMHRKQGSEQPRPIVQALPCSSSTLRFDKLRKSLMRSSRSKKKKKKKVKLCPSKKTFKGSDHNLGAQAKAESQSNMEKGSSSSLSEAKSAKKGTNQGKKKDCKPQMKSSEGQNVVAKKKRKKSRRISLVTEGDYQEVSAAEALIDMPRESGKETADCSTSLGRNLLQLAEICSTEAEDYEMAMRLQQKEKKLNKHETNLSLDSSENKAAVSSIVLKKGKRSNVRQGKRKCRDDQHSDSKDKEDLQVLKWNSSFRKNKNKSSPATSIGAFASSGEAKLVVHWGARKRRRGARIPAADFKHLIINQVVQPN